MTHLAATLPSEQKFYLSEGSRVMIESNDQDWGLCDHYLVVQDLDDYDDVEADYGDEDDDSPPGTAGLRGGRHRGRDRRGAARLETRPAGPGHPGVDHPVGPALRVHLDRRTAAGACCSPHMTRGEPGRRWREE